MHRFLPAPDPCDRPVNVHVLSAGVVPQLQYPHVHSCSALTFRRRSASNINVKVEPLTAARCTLGYTHMYVS